MPQAGEIHRHTAGVHGFHPGAACQRHHGEDRCENDGTIVAQEITAITNTGAYASSAGNVIGAMSAKVFKGYKTPNMRFVGIPVYTNTPVAGAMRGYGSPQVFFAMERQLYKIAGALGMNYTELQMKIWWIRRTATCSRGTPSATPAQGLRAPGHGTAAELAGHGR